MSVLLLALACTSTATPDAVYGTWESTFSSDDMTYGFVFAETLDAEGTSGESDVYEFSGAAAGEELAVIERGTFTMTRDDGADATSLTIFPAWRADGNDGYYGEQFITEATAKAFAADEVYFTSSDSTAWNYARLE